MQVNLAISLHAPNDEIRSKLMPIKVGGQAVLGRQQWAPTPWISEWHCIHQTMK